MRIFAHQRIYLSWLLCKWFLTSLFVVAAASFSSRKLWWFTRRISCMRWRTIIPNADTIMLTRTRQEEICDVQKKKENGIFLSIGDDMKYVDGVLFCCQYLFKNHISSYIFFFCFIYAWKENAFLFKYECCTRYYIKEKYECEEEEKRRRRE